MCSSYRSNKNPQTVKLSTTSSIPNLTVRSLVARYACVKRRCAQTARISLHPIQLQRARRQKQIRRQFPSVPRTAPPPEFPAAHKTLPRPVNHHRNPANTLKRRLRLGEAVFKEDDRSPQDQKSPTITFSSYFRICRRCHTVT